MTEEEARELLRQAGPDSTEAWVAWQRWTPAAEGGWLVLAELEGWCFAVRARLQAVVVIAKPPDLNQPAAWIVTAD
jgi:hypothetical protein